VPPVIRQSMDSGIGVPAAGERQGAADRRGLRGATAPDRESVGGW
jgi:hypothetical protein